MDRNRQDTSKWLEFLRLIYGDDVVAHLDIDYSIRVLQEPHPVWQAPFCIGMHALAHLDPDVDKSLDPGFAALMMESAGLTHSGAGCSTMHELADRVIAPLRSQYSSLVSRQEHLGTNDTQLLFYLRFALAMVLIAIGDDRPPPQWLLSGVASARTMWTGRTMSTDGLGRDVAMTKRIAAIATEDWCSRRQDYALALQLIIGATASIGYRRDSPGREELLLKACQLLDLFAETCEMRGDSVFDWIRLFDAAADIVAFGGEADSSSASPSECRLTSPQFLAWQFGRYVARFALSKRPDGVNAAGDNCQLSVEILEQLEDVPDWGNETALVSLLLECDLPRDWAALRGVYSDVFASMSSSQALPLPEVGSWSDLYWAMRIGLADGMLRAASSSTVFRRETAIDSNLIRDVGMIKDMLTGVVLAETQQTAAINKLMGRRARSNKEVKLELSNRLASVWNVIPARVVNLLVKAERFYDTGVNTDEAKLWFNKAVEAALSHCLVDPLVAMTEKRPDKRMPIPFAPPRGKEDKTGRDLRKLKLREWGDVLGVLGQPRSKNLFDLGTNELRSFIKCQYGEPSSASLQELSRSLREFSGKRKDSSHYHDSRLEQEEQELDEMRELVLGTKRVSIVSQIFHLFGSRT